VILMSSERRRAPRYQLVAEAEIVNPSAHLSLKARTSDVSLLGCFMNTTYWLAPGTEIELQLTYEGSTFIASGSVARAEPSMGFGVSFGEVKKPQRALLQKWLDELPGDKRQSAP
jgi:PilZ domain